MKHTLDQKTKNDSPLTQLSRVGVLLAALFPAALAENQSCGQESPTPITSTLNTQQSVPIKVSGVMDLVTRWNPEKNLYIEGNIGVSEENLLLLATWLKNEHPNWTIYLAEHSKNERYTDAGGTYHKGEKALEYCLGHELPNRTSFNNLVDSETGENNGAILYITFDTRRVGYFAGSAYDNRYLGEKNWAQNLDAFAIQQLKQRQVVAAVMESVKEIDGRLKTIVSKERIDRESAKNIATEELQEMEKTSLKIREAITLFQQSHPTVVGSLFEKELTSLTTTIESARGNFTRGVYRHQNECSQQIDAILSEVSQTIAEYELTPKKIEALSLTLTALRNSQYSDGLHGEFSQVEQFLIKVSQQHELGAPTFRPSLSEAERKVEELQNSIQWRENKQLLWTSMLELFAVATTVIGAYALYRQRSLRSSQQSKANFLLTEREFALDEKILKLFSLDEMTRVCIGNSVGLDNLKGESKQLAEEILTEIGQMFILGSSAKEVIKRVKEVLNPNTAWKRFQGALAQGHFTEAIAMLQTKPIVFEEGSALDTSIRVKDGDNWLKLYGELHEYSPFSVSFDELLQQFNTKGRSVERTLDTIKTSSEHILTLKIEAVALLKSLREWRGGELGVFNLNLIPHISTAGERLYISLQDVASGALLDPIGAHKECSLFVSKLKFLHNLCLTIERFVKSETTQELIALSSDTKRSPKEMEWITREIATLSDYVQEVIKQNTSTQSCAPGYHEPSQGDMYKELENSLTSITDKIRKCSLGKGELHEGSSRLQNSLKIIEQIRSDFTINSLGVNTPTTRSRLNPSGVKERLENLLSVPEGIVVLFDQGCINEASVKTAEFNKSVVDTCLRVEKLQADYKGASEAHEYAREVLQTNADKREHTLLKEIKQFKQKWGAEVLFIPSELQKHYLGLRHMDDIFNRITSIRGAILTAAQGCCSAYEGADFEEAKRLGDILDNHLSTLDILFEAPKEYQLHLEKMNSDALRAVNRVSGVLTEVETKLNAYSFHHLIRKSALDAIQKCRELLHSISSAKSPLLNQGYLRECAEIYERTNTIIEGEIKKAREVEERTKEEEKRAEETAKKATARARGSRNNSHRSSSPYGGSTQTSTNSSDSSSHGSSSSDSSSGYSSGFSSSSFDGGGSSGFSSSSW